MTKKKAEKKEKKEKKETGEEIGKEILSWCTKCGEPTPHTIVTLLKKGGPNKCECEKCKASHKYRDPEKPPKKRKKAASKKSVPVEVIWNEAMAGTEGPSKPYKMNAEFAQGDLIDHPAFGQGVVAELVGTNKIKVIFESAEKLLACNR